MGNSQSFPGLTQDVLEDYQNLTYLSKSEIVHLMKKFYSIDPSKLDENFHHRFHMEDIKAKFPVLQHNPFQDRLFRVFSSKCDDCFSFEDLLDMCSVMSADCPNSVKAAWAFRVFDIDEDNQIGQKDISDLLDRLVWDYENPTKTVDADSKKRIAEVLLEEMDLHKIGSMSSSEFGHAMSKVTEFPSSFYFRL